MNLDLPADYWIKHDPSHQAGMVPHAGIVLDASETGFLVYSVENIPIGAKLRIALLFPKDFELSGLEVNAEVIRKHVVEGSGEGYQYGVKFTRVLREDHQRLRELFIEKLLSS